MKSLHAGLWLAVCIISIIGGSLMLSAAPLCVKAKQRNVDACAVPKNQLGAWITIFVGITLLIADAAFISIFFVKSLNLQSNVQYDVAVKAVSAVLVFAVTITSIITFTQCDEFETSMTPQAGLGLSIVGIAADAFLLVAWMLKWLK